MKKIQKIAKERLILNLATRYVIITSKFISLCSHKINKGVDFKVKLLFFKIFTFNLFSIRYKIGDLGFNY